MNSQLIFDVDSHVTETANIWTQRMPSKWGNLVPHVQDIDGVEYWVVGDKKMGSVTASSYMHLDAETGERKRQPPSNQFLTNAAYRDLHPSSYDPHARLEVMDELGVQASVLYPNLNLVVSDLHEQVDDPEYKIQIIRAYNDWLVEEWAAADRERLIPVALVAYFDAEVAAEEVHRCKELGHRGLVMTGMPQLHGKPPLADTYWAPLWRAAEDTGMSVGFHVGANEGILEKYVNADRLAAEGPRRMGARTVTEAFLDNASSMNDLLLSGILPKYPKLKFVMVETGLGWVNFCLESADYHFERYGVREDCPEYTEPPSFYFKRQIYTTYWFEKIDPFHVEKVGEDKIMFETDYPHSTSLDTTDIQWALTEGMSGVSEQAKHKILWANAAELYGIRTPLLAG
ncbi:amidohydrolase family protein [Mycolicibacterium sp. XJ1819]